MNLKEQRQAVLDACQQIVDGAKASDRELSDDEVGLINAKLDEVKSIDDKIVKAKNNAELLSRLGSLGTSTRESNEGHGFAAKSLGEHFVHYAAARLAEVKGTRFSVAAPEFGAKAATDTVVTTGLTFPQIDTNVVQAYRRPFITDLFGSGSLSSPSITYYVEGPSAGAPAPVGENQPKAQVSYTYTTVTEALTKIAGFVKISDEMAEDLDFLVSEVNGRLIYDLQLVEEQQLLYGNGTAPQLRGVLNRVGILTEAPAAGADNLNAIFSAAMQIQEVSGLAADGVVVNPTDYETFRLSTDANGQYFGGGPFQGPYGNGGVTWQPPLWGLRTVVTSAIQAGTALVGAFAQAATVYRKGGLRVESTNSDQDDFTHNRITIRAEERLALAVRKPSGFCEVTLSAVAGALSVTATAKS